MTPLTRFILLILVTTLLVDRAYTLNQNSNNYSSIFDDKNFSLSLDALFLIPSADTIAVTNAYSPVLTTHIYSLFS